MRLKKHEIRTMPVNLCFHGGASVCAGAGGRVPGGSKGCGICRCPARGPQYSAEPRVLGAARGQV